MADKKEKKIWKPASYHTLVAKDVVKQESGHRYLIVDGNVYSVDLSSEAFKKHMKEKAKAKLARRSEIVEARLKKRMARSANKLKREATKAAARSNKKEIQIAMLEGRTEAKIKAIRSS